MRKVFPFAACVALLTACGSDSTGPSSVTVSGSLSFSYTGAGAASSTPFSANGTSPTDTLTFGSSSWAGGSTETAGELDILAVNPVSATTWNVGVITVASQATGAFTINAQTCSTTCNTVSFLVGATGTPETLSAGSFQFLCELTTGTITVASINSTN